MQRLRERLPTAVLGLNRRGRRHGRRRVALQLSCAAQDRRHPAAMRLRQQLLRQHLCRQLTQHPLAALLCAARVGLRVWYCLARMLARLCGQRAHPAALRAAQGGRRAVRRRVP